MAEKKRTKTSPDATEGDVAHVFVVFSQLIYTDASYEDTNKKIFTFRTHKQAVSKYAELCYKRFTEMILRSGERRIKLLMKGSGEAALLLKLFYDVDEKTGVAKLKENPPPPSSVSWDSTEITDYLSTEFDDQAWDCSITETLLH